MNLNLNFEICTSENSLKALNSIIYYITSEKVTKLSNIKKIVKWKEQNVIKIAKAQHLSNPVHRNTNQVDSGKVMLINQ